jgi:hypothetical protein
MLTRRDSQKAENHELMPLTSLDSDGEGTPRAASRPTDQLGSMKGKRLAYTGSASDMDMAWPMNSAVKMKGRSTSPPTPTATNSPLVNRLRRVAQDGRHFTDRKLQGLRQKARRPRRQRTLFDDRFDALAELCPADEDANFDTLVWERLYNRSHSAVEAVIPQLCSYLLVNASATMRWPDDGEGSLEPEPEPERSQLAGNIIDQPAAPLAAGESCSLGSALRPCALTGAVAATRME